MGGSGSSRRWAGDALRPSRPVPSQPLRRSAPLQPRGGGGVTAAPSGRSSRAGDPSVTLRVWAWARARGAPRHPRAALPAGRAAAPGCREHPPGPLCGQVSPLAAGAGRLHSPLSLSLPSFLSFYFFLIICITMIFADFLRFFFSPRRGGRSGGGSRARARGGAGRRAALPSCPF